MKFKIVEENAIPTWDELQKEVHKDDIFKADFYISIGSLLKKSFRQKLEKAKENGWDIDWTERKGIIENIFHIIIKDTKENIHKFYKVLKRAEK